MSEIAPHSEDQSEAYQALLPVLHDEIYGVFGVAGKAGSGKTRLLSDLVDAARAEDFKIVEPDFERKLKKDQRSLAVLTPTNKASAVLRARGVPATTLHRILYTPLYHPEYEDIAEWIAEGGKMPQSDKIAAESLERARAFFEEHQSVPSAFAIIGVRGADFITGWKRRDDTLDVGLVDESSMLDDQQIADLKEIFPTLVLFGDPAQLAPVGASKGMVFDQLEKSKLHILHRIHRQDADNPILDLAHALADPNLDYHAFVARIEAHAAEDDRIVVTPRIQTELMAKSPVLVWRNATRKRLIAGFRRAYEIGDSALRPGEPLICDGIELPAKHRAKRIDLEARGLIKGAQVSYLGSGKKMGFARLFVHGAVEPYVSVASIIQIESPDSEEPQIISAARMGAVFIHGAASTIHKAQGSQWPEVQVFAPDIAAAARSGRNEVGIPLWKRLAYVALTRAEERLYWVTDYRMQKPTAPIDSYDLRQSFNARKFELKAQ